MPYKYVGIDVSKFKHTCCIMDDNGEIIKNSFDSQIQKKDLIRLQRPSNTLIIQIILG